MKSELLLAIIIGIVIFLYYLIFHTEVNRNIEDITYKIKTKSRNNKQNVPTFLFI